MYDKRNGPGDFINYLHKNVADKRMASHIGDLYNNVYEKRKGPGNILKYLHKNGDKRMGPSQFIKDMYKNVYNPNKVCIILSCVMLSSPVQVHSK